MENRELVVSEKNVHAKPITTFVSQETPATQRRYCGDTPIYRQKEYTPETCTRTLFEIRLPRNHPSQRIHPLAKKAAKRIHSAYPSIVMLGHSMCIIT